MRNNQRYCVGPNLDYIYLGKLKKSVCNPSTAEEHTASPSAYGRVHTLPAPKQTLIIEVATEEPYTWLGQEAEATKGQPAWPPHRLQQIKNSVAITPTDDFQKADGKL